VCSQSTLFPFVAPCQHDSSTVGYTPGAVSFARKEESASKGREPVVARVPWYRTRRGIIVAVVAIIVIVGATVGGIVGGTHHSSKPKGDTAGEQTSGTGNTTTTQQGQASKRLAPPPLPHPQPAVLLRPMSLVSPSPPSPPMLPLVLLVPSIWSLIG